MIVIAHLVKKPNETKKKAYREQTVENGVRINPHFRSARRLTSQSEQKVESQPP